MCVEFLSKPVHQMGRICIGVVYTTVEHWVSWLSLTSIKQLSVKLIEHYLFGSRHNYRLDNKLVEHLKKTQQK